jgi:Rieske Fe-S protein
VNLRSGKKHAPNEITRRQFIKTTTYTSGTLLVGLAVGGCKSEGNPTTGSPTATTPDGIVIDLSLPENQALLAVGGSLALDSNVIDADGLLVVRNAIDNAVAFSRRCPHQGCQINPYVDNLSICPCHNSSFDLNGGVVQGPAKQALKSYPVTLTEKEITIHAS